MSETAPISVPTGWTLTKLPSGSWQLLAPSGMHYLARNLDMIRAILEASRDRGY